MKNWIKLILNKSMLLTCNSLWHTRKLHANKYNSVIQSLGSRISCIPSLVSWRSSRENSIEPLLDTYWICTFVFMCVVRNKTKNLFVEYYKCSRQRGNSTICYWKVGRQKKAKERRIGRTRNPVYASIGNIFCFKWNQRSCDIALIFFVTARHNE